MISSIPLWLAIAQGVGYMVVLPGNPGHCSVNSGWTFHTMLSCFSSPGHLTFKTEQLILSSARKNASFPGLSWRNCTCRVETPAKNCHHWDPRMATVRDGGGVREGVGLPRSMISLGSGLSRSHSVWLGWAWPGDHQIWSQNKSDQLEPWSIHGY